jgi:hypothetical protein
VNPLESFEDRQDTASAVRDLFDPLIDHFTPVMPGFGALSRQSGEGAEGTHRRRGVVLQGGYRLPFCHWERNGGPSRPHRQTPGPIELSAVSLF